MAVLLYSFHHGESVLCGCARTAFGSKSSDSMDLPFDSIPSDRYCKVCPLEFPPLKNFFRDYLTKKTYYSNLL